MTKTKPLPFEVGITLLGITNVLLPKMEQLVRDTGHVDEAHRWVISAMVPVIDGAAKMLHGLKEADEDGAHEIVRCAKLALGAVAHAFQDMQKKREFHPLNSIISEIQTAISGL